VKAEAIVFDMYGTVANLAAVTRACEDLVEKPAEFGSFWRMKQLEYTFLLSIMEDYQDFWQVTEAALHFTVKATREQLTQEQQSFLMEKWLRPEPFPDARDGLERMKGRYPLAILSNGSPRMLESGLEHAGLDSCFDQVISVEEVKVYKPSPAVYGLVPSRLGIAREGVLFVSSNSFDVIGAGKYGFQTCWIKRAENPLDLLGVEPDLVVSSFEELAFLVR